MPRCLGAPRRQAQERWKLNQRHQPTPKERLRLPVTIPRSSSHWFSQLLHRCLGSRNLLATISVFKRHKAVVFSAQAFLNVLRVVSSSSSNGSMIRVFCLPAKCDFVKWQDRERTTAIIHDAVVASTSTTRVSILSLIHMHRLN